MTDPKDGDTCHQGFRVSLTLFYLPERAESLLKYLNLLWGMSNKFFTAVKSRKGFSLGTTRRCSGTTLSDKSELIEGRARKVMDFKYVSENFSSWNSVVGVLKLRGYSRLNLRPEYVLDGGNTRSLRGSGQEFKASELVP